MKYKYMRNEGASKCCGIILRISNSRPNQVFARRLLQDAGLSSCPFRRKRDFQVRLGVPGITGLLAVPFLHTVPSWLT